MIKYNRNRSLKVLEGVNIAFGNAAVHERAMCFYSNMYKLTKLKWCEKKFNEHKAAAIVEMSAQLGVLLNEISVLESAINEELRS